MARSWRERGTVWAAGEWTLERRGDEFADIAFRGRRVLRSIRGVARDRDWNTVEWAVQEVLSIEGMLRLRLVSVTTGAALEGELTLEASADRLSTTFDVVPRHPFSTNRTGLVVLHPPQLAGTALSVRHADGRVEDAVFPREISPHQPVDDIAALGWQHEGLRVEMEFSGDVFEMEDQRNWTDASYKTYSRPLALPFPYELAAGERVRQTVAVTAQASGVVVPRTHLDLLDLRPAGAFPAVTVGASTAADPSPVVPRVGSSLLVELDLASPAWKAALDRAAASGLALDVRFVLDDACPESLAEGVRALRPYPIARVTAFQATGPARHVSDAAAITRLREALASDGLAVDVVGGARSHFTELNREQERLPRDLDGIVFSVTPLFHSLTTEQLVESLGIQRLIAAQSVGIAAGAPVHIGPITLRPHLNSVATTPPPMPAHPDLREGYGPHLIGADDERQARPELAAWTVASAAALAVPGVATLSFFEEWGPRGIRAGDGAPLPVAAAVEALASLAGSPSRNADSPDGLLWAIGAESAGITTVLVSNLDIEARRVRVRVDDVVTEMTLAAGTWRRLEVPTTAAR